MYHPVYGNQSLSTIPMYIILAIFVLCFGLTLKYAYKHNTKLANIMNKIFAWSMLVNIILIPIVAISVIVFIVYIILKL